MALRMLAKACHHSSPCHVLHRQRNGVLGHHSLSGRSVGRNEDAVAHFEAVHCLLLEVVEFEGVL